MFRTFQTNIPRIQLPKNLDFPSKIGNDQRCKILIGQGEGVLSMFCWTGEASPGPMKSLLFLTSVELKVNKFNKNDFLATQIHALFLLLYCL